VAKEMEMLRKIAGCAQSDINSIFSSPRVEKLSLRQRCDEMIS
jgi:hypothetical protein